MVLIVWHPSEELGIYAWVKADLMNMKTTEKPCAYYFVLLLLISSQFSSVNTGNKRIQTTVLEKI